MQLVGWSVVGILWVSTIVGYSMPNPVYSFILNTIMICGRIICRQQFLNEPQ